MDTGLRQFVEGLQQGQRNLMAADGSSLEETHVHVWQPVDARC
jgi:hypothetical protein